MRTEIRRFIIFLFIRDDATLWPGITSLIVTGERVIFYYRRHRLPSGFFKRVSCKRFYIVRTIYYRFRITESTYSISRRLNRYIVILSFWTRFVIYYYNYLLNVRAPSNQFIWRL